MKILITLISALFFCIAGYSQTVALASANPAIRPGVIVQGSEKNIIYTFNLSAGAASSYLSTVRFTTTNSDASDITNYRLWYNTINTFAGVKSIGNTISSGLGSGAHTFTLTTLLTLEKDSQYYFFITADVSIAAVSKIGNTISVSAISLAAGDFKSATTLSGAANAGGLQIITEASAGSNAAKPDTTARDILTNQPICLNAVSLDVGKGFETNYLFHLNWYVPPKLGKKNWGCNLGFTKINYSNNDTAQERTLLDNVIINPLKPPVVGGQYLKQINTLTTRIKQTGLSFYIQALYSLSKVTAKNQIYLHAHAETFINKYIVTNTTTTLKQDTALWDGSPIRANLNPVTTLKNTFIDGFFGIGLTFDLLPTKNVMIFIQPTIGFTTGSPALSPFSSPDFNNRRLINSKEWNKFYLARVNCALKLSSSSAAIIGFDLRGYFPRFTPSYAAFAGINISLPDVLKIAGIKIS